MPIIFGCHCRADRSFHWKGRQFPICARCTGELLGILAAVATYFPLRPSPWLMVGMMLPMLADGFLQLLTAYESTNPRRLLTGILFGYSLTGLYLLSATWTFQYGKSLTA